MRFIRPIVFCLGVAALTSGCGGSQPEAKEPASTEEPAAKSEGESDIADSKAQEPGAKETAKASKEAPADPEPDLKRSLKDILTREDVMFAFTFNASEPFQVAEKACVEKAKDDMKKKSECMSKAASKFESDLLSFEKDDEDKYWYVTSRRKGDKLTTLHKIPVDFGEEKGTSITIKPTGRDKGTKPIANPKEVTIDVPSESEIVLVDPAHGKMVYQAKMGMKGR
jgi:hypothetical protein